MATRTIYPQVGPYFLGNYSISMVPGGLEVTRFKLAAYVLVETYEGRWNTYRRRKLLRLRLPPDIVLCSPFP